MKIIEQYFEEITESDVYRKIEMIGRICYKSEDKITKDSYKKFIKSIIASGHESVLEHGTVLLEVSHMVYGNLKKLNFKYLNFTENQMGIDYISGNIRAFRDIFRTAGDSFYKVFLLYRCLKKQFPLFFDDIVINDREYDIEPSESNFVVIINPQIDSHFFATDEEKLNHIYRTIKFVTDRGVTHELVRHRPVSYSQESTRYCNYSKGKFGGELTFINPVFWKKYGEEDKRLSWHYSLLGIEGNYMELIEKGAIPQEARSVLPNSLKTEIAVTTNLKEWAWIMKLRTSEKAHPQIRELMLPLQKKFKLEYPKLF